VVQLNPRATTLIVFAVALLLLGGAGRFDAETVAAGVATAEDKVGTAAGAVVTSSAGIEVVGAARTESIDRVATILTRDLGLPLPAGTRVHVYPTPAAFRRGLVKDAKMREDGADELAAFAIGIARPGRVLLNARLAGSGIEWLRLIAHELTHVSQFELAGDEGRAEQWLAEGMAEHVAFQVLERLDAGSLSMHRRVALARVQQQPAFATGRLDLGTLGSPRDFTLRHQREGSVETYHLSFLLADYLIERHGFGTMVEYFARLKRQRSDAAFRAAFGSSIATFETLAILQLQTMSRAGD